MNNHIKLFESWMNEAEMSIPAGHIAAVIINDESARMSGYLTNWIKQNATRMSLDNMEPQDFALPTSKGTVMNKDLDGKLIIFTGYNQAMDSVKQIVDKMELKTLDAATTEIADLALPTSKGLSLNTNVKIVKMNEAEMNEATFGLDSRSNFFPTKNMRIPANNKVELDAEGLLDILKGDVKTKMGKLEVIRLLSNPAEFAAAVKYVTDDKKEGFLILKLFKRLARKEIETDKVIAASYDALINVFFDKYDAGEFDENDEFFKWSQEVKTLTTTAEKREILTDSIEDTENRIKALQSSLVQMKNELKELK